jgi:uncharacterized protein (DUF2164 family)
LNRKPQYLFSSEFYVDIMEKTDYSPNIVSEEKRNEYIRQIIDFFKNERSEEIGIIAAENLLDHFLESMGKDFYNKGVEDARNYLKDRFLDIEIDMESLLKK